ncbi:MAG: hypothetical protein KAY99_01035 [Faecalibacterium sp.]|mgnify:FL=1|nr:hypothetical protein [Faecalibacterium sp.]
MFKKIAVAGALVSLGLLVLTSCGSTASAGVESAGAEAAKGVSNIQPTEQKTENAYEKFRRAEEENVIGDEEQQLAELSAALEKLEFEYAEDETIGDFLMVASPRCGENIEQGKSCVMPLIYILGPSVEPLLVVGFDCVGDEYLGIDTVEVDTNRYRYTLNSTNFIGDIEKGKVEILSSQEKMIELAMGVVTTDEEIDMLIDMIESDAVNLRFGKYNTAKPDLVECPMPENDKQAIVDVLNAYYLYLNTTQAVRARALAELT